MGCAQLATEPLRLRGGGYRSRSRSPGGRRDRVERGTRRRSRGRSRSRSLSRSPGRGRDRFRPRDRSPGASGKAYVKPRSRGRKYRAVNHGGKDSRVADGEVEVEAEQGQEAQEKEEEEPGSWALMEARRIEEEVCRRVEVELQSSTVQGRVEARLMEERCKLEMQVTQQIEVERRALLQKERRRLAEEMRHRRELANILAENQRKVQHALKKAEEERQASRNLGLTIEEGLI
mmetsp:Transcript_16682/g.46624  ORF Transcript_16682/g.46624 Transcript_16682/m.46624 type:complete len:233 (-) Transcript_16682:309-1007(-)